MIIPIPSRQKRFLLKVGIRAFQPMTLGIRAFDPYLPNTDYIRRKLPFSKKLFYTDRGYKEFTLPFPLSPQDLMLNFFDKADGNDSSFKIEKLKLENLPAKQVWAEPEIHRFIPFAQDFAQRAGHLSEGVYDSRNAEFLIHYMPLITNENNYPLVTPARTNRHTGRIQVARQQFIRYTIPIRMVILFHERYHYQIPTRLESLADRSALKLFLDLQFPRTEAVYATTKVFLSHPESVGEAHAIRVKENLQFIDDYSRKHHLKLHEDEVA